MAAVFEGVSFYIAEKLVKNVSKLKSVLVGGGAQREFYPSELVSHVVSDSLPPPSLGLSRCTASLVLHSDWVYMSSKCGVMLPTAPFILTGDKLFSNLVFCPSKLPRRDVEKLACLVLYLGGRMQQRLDAAVTHLVTMETTGAKYECAVRHSVEVVIPDWMLDSVSMGRLADEGEYRPSERGRGKDSLEAVQCNGDPNDAIEDHQEITEVNQKDQNEAMTDPGEAIGDHGEAKESKKEATADDEVPPDGNFKASEELLVAVRDQKASAEDREGGLETSEAVMERGEEEMEILSGEGELDEWQGVDLQAAEWPGQPHAVPNLPSTASAVASAVMPADISMSAQPNTPSSPHPNTPGPSSPGVAITPATIVSAAITPAQDQGGRAPASPGVAITPATIVSAAVTPAPDQGGKTPASPGVAITPATIVSAAVTPAPDQGGRTPASPGVAITPATIVSAAVTPAQDQGGRTPASPGVAITPATIVSAAVTPAQDQGGRTPAVEVAGVDVQCREVATEAKSNGAVAVMEDGCGQEKSRLLASLVFHLTGYLECMEEDTLGKWKEVIVQHGGSVVDSYDPELCTHLLALHKKSDTFARAYADGKCISSAHWLNDVLTEGRMFPPRCALHFPTAFKWQISGADNYSITLTNYTGGERELVKDMIHLTGIPYTGHLSRTSSYLICKSPSGKKYEKAVEWGVTVVNASFLADIIHNGQVPAVLYSRHARLGQSDEFLPTHCFEASRLLWPWEAFLQRYAESCGETMDRDTTEQVFGCVRRRGREGRQDEGEVGPAKRRRLEAEGEGPPVVMLTGISQSIAKKLKTIIQSLGGTVTDRPRECTHIVAPRVARTVKFLSGISVCRYMVTPEWVEQCEREEGLVNEEGFTLRDVDAEETFAMDIRTTLSRARASKLLQGYCLHATASVQPAHDNLREIIECAGGQLLSSAQVQSQFGRKMEKLASSSWRLVVLSTPEDLAAGLCALFTSHGVPVYNAELVLTGALTQQLDLSQNVLSPPGTAGSRPATDIP